VIVIKFILKIVLVLIMQLILVLSIEHVVTVQGKDYIQAVFELVSIVAITCFVFSRTEESK